MAGMLSVDGADLRVMNFGQIGGELPGETQPLPHPQGFWLCGQKRVTATAFQPLVPWVQAGERTPS